MPPKSQNRSGGDMRRFVKSKDVEKKPQAWAVGLDKWTLSFSNSALDGEWRRLVAGRSRALWLRSLLSATLYQALRHAADTAQFGPAPQWVVNSRAKTAFTQFLASALDPEFDLETSAAAVERIIASDDMVVFSATYCPFSAAAKQALAAEGVPFTAVEWNTTEGGAGFAPALARRTGRSSIPHVFIAGESIGGCNDGNPGIRPLIASGGLDAKLAKCSKKTQDARAAFLEARGNVSPKEGGAA